MVTLLFSEIKLFSRSAIDFATLSELFSEFRSLVLTWRMMFSLFGMYALVQNRISTNQSQTISLLSHPILYIRFCWRSFSYFNIHWVLGIWLFRSEIVNQTSKMIRKHNERRIKLSEAVGTSFSHTKTFKFSFESVDMC